MEKDREIKTMIVETNLNEHLFFISYLNQHKEILFFWGGWGNQYTFEKMLVLPRTHYYVNRTGTFTSIDDRETRI